MAPDTTKQQSMFNLAATVAAYLTLNSTLNLMNKWLLGIYGFSFPLLLTSCHMLFSFLILLPFMLRDPFRSLHAATLQKQWKGIIGIGLFMAVNIAFNNLSLVQITLSLNQVIRSVLLLLWLETWTYCFSIHACKLASMSCVQVIHPSAVLCPCHLHRKENSLWERNRISSHLVLGRHDSCLGGKRKWKSSRHHAMSGWHSM